MFKTIAKNNCKLTNSVNNSDNNNVMQITVRLSRLFSLNILIIILTLLSYLPNVKTHTTSTTNSLNSALSHQRKNNHHQHHHNRHHIKHQQRLLLLSFGGLRHDFIESYNLRNFLKFISEGSRAAYLNPQFATQAFPNHWSIATGSYVENHGIVANKFYDPLYNEYFSKQSTQLKWWNESEPFWSSAVRQGVKTGVYFWPGSETLFSNENDLYTYVPYNENLPFGVKVNQAIRWLAHEDYKLVCVYHNQPDAIAHKYGINSPEFNVTLNQLDESFGELIANLKAASLYDSETFNLVVVSDHGLANIRKNIVINDYFDENDAQVWSFSRNLIHLRPMISIDRLLSKLARIPDITVTLKADMPERLHYKHNRRIGDVVVSALEGVGFVYMSKEPMQINGRTSSVMLTYEQKKRLLIAASDKASHGYDKIYPSMRGVFMARGPIFKNNYSSDNFIENIDLYPLVCNLLAINCPTRNGSFERVKRFLKLDHKYFYEISKSNNNNNNNNAFYLNSVRNVSCFVSFKSKFSLLFIYFLTAFFIFFDSFLNV